MPEKELLLKIKINYPRRIMTSKSRRAKYFKRGDNLPMKYLDKNRQVDRGYLQEVQVKDYATNAKGLFYMLDRDYIWKEHKLTKKRIEERLYNTVHKEYVIKNPKVAGTENWKIISGQDIYRFGMQNWNVSNIMMGLHNYLIEELTRLNIPPITKYPIYIHYHFNCTMNDDTMDVDNYGLPYYKAFQDCLKKVGVIINDTRRYIRGFKVTSDPIEESTDRVPIDTLTVTIYADRI